MSLGKSVLRNLPVSVSLSPHQSPSCEYCGELCSLYVCRRLRSKLDLEIIVSNTLKTPSRIFSTCIDEWKLDPNNIYDCIERKQNGELRYCRNENCYKPDRAHYCRPLGRNVLKMDHYCPWVLRYGACSKLKLSLGNRSLFTTQLFTTHLIITNKTTIECFSWNSTPKHSYNLGLFHNIQAVLVTYTLVIFCC
uniref:Palmitoyltransferase n=1 Tax=Theileria parva TaxID=5875 RepID=Q4N8A3_THEPA|eukprot:XP_766088.1 hypothetical protein [Theileria parva strain Muguga]